MDDDKLEAILKRMDEREAELELHKIKLRERDLNGR